MHEHATNYRVAIVSVSPIFHAHAGNATYLAAFCRALRALGCRVEVFLLQPSTPSIVTRYHAEYLAATDSFHPRTNLRIGNNYLSLDPLQWARVARRPFRSRFQTHTTQERLWDFPAPSRSSLIWVRGHLARFRPHLVVANYFNASTAFAQASRHVRKAILVHDVLAIRQQSFQSARIAPDFDPCFIEAEARAFDQADLCLAINEEESRHIAERHSSIRAAVFPYVTAIHGGELRRTRAPLCLFVGSDNVPNRDGLRWLLKEVWPRVTAADPRIRLRIVGTVPSDTAVQETPNVEYAGPVADLRTEYLKAAVALVPLRVGSGLKIKLVEALAHGVPAVATRCGAAGLPEPPVDCLRIHDAAQDFAQAVVDMAVGPCRQQSRESALVYAQRHFSEASAIERLQAIFSELNQ